MRLTISPGLLALVATASAAHAETPVIVVRGEGVQIYGCSQTETGYAWRFKAPEAIVRDAGGNTVGHHFTGPSWQAQDGSLVTGTVLSTSQASVTSAIPWLVLAAKDYSGAGLFANVAYVVRSETVGGIAPLTAAMRRTPAPRLVSITRRSIRFSLRRNSDRADLSTPRRVSADSCGRSGAWAWISPLRDTGEQVTNTRFGSRSGLICSRLRVACSVIADRQPTGTGGFTKD